MKANGVDTHRDVIISRYQRKSEELYGSNHSTLGYYFHNKHPLSHFFVDGGASYFNHLMNALYAIQATNPDAQLYDIQDAIDRNISRLTTSFKKWLIDKDYTYEVAKQYDDFELKYINSSII